MLILTINNAIRRLLRLFIEWMDLLTLSTGTFIERMCTFIERVGCFIERVCGFIERVDRLVEGVCFIIVCSRVGGFRAERGARNSGSESERNL